MPGAPRLTLAVVVLLLTVLAGCMHPEAPDVPEAEAERIALNGMRDLALALADRDAGRLRAFDMVITAPMHAGSETESVATLEAHLEWGQQGVSRRNVVLEDDRARHETTVWCTSSYVFYDWDGDVYQERAVRAPERDDPCRFDGMRQAANLLAPFTPEGAEELPLPYVSVQGREVTAVFEDDDGGRLVVSYDAGGSVLAVKGDGLDGSFEAFVTYGPRPLLVPPEATERLPARIETVRQYDELMERDVYEVVASWHEPRLEEIEARWVARDPLAAEPIVLLALPLTGTLADDSVRFHFEDVDGDGRVTRGDRYWFDEPADEAGGLLLREMVLYDLWADEEVNADVPAPVPGLIIVAFLGLVAVARRRAM